MSILETDQVNLHYQIEGPADAPVLVLANSLGTELGMWAPQMPRLLEHFRVLRHDARGHGQSQVAPGPYTIAQLASDVIALLDHLQIERADFCGLSMGGMIGMWLGAHFPTRIRRLVLSNTAAQIPPPEAWNQRIDKVTREGMAAIAPAVIERWFTPAFAARAPQQVELVRNMLLHTEPAGYVANCAAVRDMDQRNGLSGISAPTLVIAGSHDKSTPPQDGQFVAQQIPGARYLELDAAHLSNWEQADQFTTAVIDFLTAK
jgi:3-oxoadipate enol-lactonase